MADDTQQQPQQQPQAPAQPDLNAMIQALIQRQMAVASGQGQQVQLPPTPQAQTQYSNDPSQGPDLLARIGLAIGGGSLPGAPAQLQQQMGKQALLNFGIGLLSAGRFSTPGEALAGGLRGAQGGLLGSEAAQAGQQEYALGSREKLAELGLTQQKNQTEALTSLVPLLQMQGRLGLPPLFGGGAGGPGGGGGPGGTGGGGGDTALTGDMAHDQPIIAARESGGNPNALNYVAMQDPSAYGRGATASGKYQFVNSTWQEGLKLAGIENPQQYPTAMSAPENVQDQVFKAVYGKYGTAPWDASKFGANWQQQPGGGYQLVKSAQPPASGPGSAVGPYKVASNAPAAPSGGWVDPQGTFTGDGRPSTPPSAGGGAPSIGSELQPPTPGSAANVVPGLSAADAAVIAKQSGRDVPFGDQGMVAHADGSVGTGAKGSGGGISGKRADIAPPGSQVAQDVAAIQAGRQGGVPDGGPAAALAAGPAAPTGGAGTIGGAVLPAMPGLAAGVAPPVGPIRPPAVVAQPPAAPTPPPVSTQPPAVTPQQPPAPTPQPPAPTPKPASRAQDYSVQDTDLTPEEYQDRHFVPLTPEQVKTYAPGPSGDEAAAAANQVQRAQANVAAMQTQLDQQRRGLIAGDPARQAGQVTDAEKELDAAQNTYNDQVQKLAQGGATNLLNRDNAERARVSADYKAQVIDPRNTAAQIALQGKQQIALEQAKGQTASDTKVMDTLNETQTAARDAIDQTNLARSLSRASGDPGFWQMMQQSHPETVKWLSNAGALPQETVQQLGTANAMDAAFNKLITMARFGTGFSRPTNLDVQILTSQAPEGTDPQAWREAKLAYMQTYMQRQDDYVNKVYSYHSQPNVSLHQAQVMARGDMGDIVPQMDAQTAADPALRTKWAQTTLAPNTFFRAPDGQLRIWPPPGTQATTSAPPPGRHQGNLVPTN